MDRRRAFRIALRIVTGALLTIITGLLALALFPLNRPALDLPSHPFDSFEKARTAALAGIANNPPEVREQCRDILFDHGSRTRDVYVLLHGLTNCPAQFREFGQRLFDGGANVFIPRTPFHGLTDRLTPKQQKLTARDMAESANEAVDIAHGLGERVIVVGLSVNAVTAAWLAQERPDIALAVIIAPFLAPSGVPDFLIAPASRLLLRLPNVFIWWDPRVRADLPGSPFSYPRFPTRAIGEVMEMGVEVFRLAKSHPPATRRILFITSPTDPAISLPRVRELAAIWSPHADVRDLEFPADWNVPHDCIDPKQTDQQIERVYPQIIEWMNAALP